MLDAETYPKTEIIALYLKRWNVELDFDAIQETLVSFHQTLLIAEGLLSGQRKTGF